MALKKLLVAFTTNRATEDEPKRRVRFKAGDVVDLTEDEMKTFDLLTKKTGKLHYRAPVNEGSSAVTESKPTVIEVPDYAGQDVPMADKTVAQLKSFLTFKGVEFDDKAAKADLLALATDADKPADAADGDNGL